MDEVIEKEIVDDLIYEVRGVQVMLDSDLARFVMMKKYMMQYVIATFISKKIGILDKKKVYISILIVILLIPIGMLSLLKKQKRISYLGLL